jgi:hypothetical protein
VGWHGKGSCSNPYRDLMNIARPGSSENLYTSTIKFEPLEGLKFNIIYKI